ncbi:hypothetical protein QF028_000064 [Neobacillus sp. B4I6]|uniref:hypothetical protein n=1 Tax=Neobacillus sp. B4I6 TaxID=3373925 RepID=UPI003D205ED3
MHPVYVPQMKDAKEVLKGIEQNTNIQYIEFIPNEKGYDLAVRNGVRVFHWLYI